MNALRALASRVGWTSPEPPPPPPSPYEPPKPPTRRRPAAATPKAGDHPPSPSNISDAEDEEVDSAEDSNARPRSTRFGNAMVVALKEINDALDQGDWSSAESQCRAALRTWPDWRSARETAATLKTYLTAYAGARSARRRPPPPDAGALHLETADAADPLLRQRVDALLDLCQEHEYEPEVHICLGCGSIRADWFVCCRPQRMIGSGRYPNLGPTYKARVAHLEGELAILQNNWIQEQDAARSAQVAHLMDELEALRAVKERVGQRMPLHPCDAHPATPLVHDGRPEGRTVRTFGEDVVYAYLDTHLEAAVRARLRLPSATYAERVAQMRLRQEAMPPPPQHVLEAHEKSVVQTADGRVAADLGSAPDDDDGLFHAFDYYTEEPKHDLLEALDERRARRNAAFLARCRVVPLLPRDVWSCVAAFGDVKAFGRSLAACHLLKDAGRRSAQVVFEGALRKFPAAALQRPYLRDPYDAAGQLRKFLRISRADGRHPPAPLQPARAWDDYVITIELVRRARREVLCAAVCHFDATAVGGAELRTDRVEAAVLDVFSQQAPREEDWAALDDVAVRVLCLDRRTGRTAGICAAGGLEDFDYPTAYFETECVPVQTVIEGFAPFAGDGGQVPAVDASYDGLARVFTLRFITIGFDVDEMRPDEVLLMLEHFVDFGDFERVEAAAAAAGEG